MISLQVQKKLHAAGGDMMLDLRLEIRRGTFVTLYGPSGAGKTSTLRLLAGLLPADAGNISVDGRRWFDAGAGINLPPGDRRIGYVFQDYALFPNMTVRENLVFASGKGGEPTLIEELLERMELGALAGRKPATLSGGQQQRVALARALAQRPDILLLDEPLAALDLSLRRRLREHLLDAHQDFGLTTILVSHDTEDILSLSDRLIELREGKIINDGKPAEVLFPELHPEALQMIATITGLEPRGERLTLEVLVTFPRWPNPRRRFTLPAERAAAWRIGQELLIEVDETGLRFQEHP